MTAVHAAFSCRYERRAGAVSFSVLTERYDSIRSDVIVDLPVRQDWHRGSLHGTSGLYEKVWIDPVYAITEIYNVDYSSGLASCLAVRFDVQQSYMGGTETWHGSHQVDFANGKAVCLWQTYEVVQDYLGGAEAWTSSFAVDFALGRAVCLWQTFEVIQDYLGGSETWSSSHGQDFALGRAVCLWQRFEVIQGYLGGSEAWTSAFGQDFALGRSICLYQTYQINQPYVGGNELWPTLYESFYSSGESTVLDQRFDVVQPYHGGREDWTFRFDSCSVSETGQVFLFSTENSETAGLGVTVVGAYDFKKYVGVGVVFALEHIADASCFEAVFSHNHLFYSHYLANAKTDTVLIDTLGGRPRAVELVSIFEVPETSSFELIARYDFTECASVCLPSFYGISNAGFYLLLLQEEAYCEYVACLTNIHTGMLTVAVTPQLNESLDSLAKHCSGNFEWQLEYETKVRFYSPDRPEQSRDAVSWRFLTQEGKHWKPEPVVTALRATRLPSFIEVHFYADWPYRSIEMQIGAYQFQRTEDDDWFDLGIWTSESILIDTKAPPILILPYSCDIRNYAVHVPRGETTKFIAVAPIRRFPFEEIGMLAQIDIT